MIPKKLYRKVTGGFESEKTEFRNELRVPERPKNDTKPRAIRSVGIQKGTEENERRIFFSGKERFAVKKAAATPKTSAITVEQRA